MKQIKMCHEFKFILTICISFSLILVMAYLNFLLLVGEFICICFFKEIFEKLSEAWVGVASQVLLCTWNKEWAIERCLRGI